MQMTIIVGMPGISHSSPTKQHALTMLHHPLKDPNNMWDIPDEGGQLSPPDTELNRYCCDITCDCINAKKMQLGYMVHNLN